jgi:hypothetical protein
MWALAASVVTVLFINTALDNPLLRKGAVRPLLRVRENIAVQCSGGERRELRERITLKL